MRYIPKEYFINKNQQRNDEIRDKNDKEWDALYDEIQKEVKKILC